MGNSDITELFGKHLRRLRRERKTSQETLASKAGCDISTLGRTERGEVAPTIKMVDKLSRALGVGIPELFDFSEERGEDEVIDRLKDQLETLVRESEPQTLDLFSLIMADFIHFHRKQRSREVVPPM